MLSSGILYAEDHLHIRGEYIDLVDTRQMYVGSSPHTWRIRDAVWEENWIGRIISTYVENTRKSSHYGREVEDHLHIRGEYR